MEEQPSPSGWLGEPSLPASLANRAERGKSSRVNCVMKRMLLVTLLLNACCVFAAEVPGPTALREAAEYSGVRRGYSLLVMHNDRVIFEDYENGARAGDTHKIYSGTKGFWAVAAMCAIQDGLLTLDERVSDTITEWRNDPRRSRVTMLQLLNFTDGIDPANHIHSDDVYDRNAYALTAPAVAAPGQAFLYGGSHLQVFNEVLRRKLRTQTPYAYLQKKVLTPLGLAGIEYKKDGVGTPLMASGFRLTARQWAKFGELILHRGGKVVPAPLLDQCFRGSAACPAFGIGFWNNAQAARPGAREIDVEDMLEKKWWQQDWHRVCLCRDAPTDMIASIGSEYQRMFMIPSLDLVIVRQGLNARFSDADFLRILLGR